MKTRHLLVGWTLALQCLVGTWSPAAATQLLAYEYLPGTAAGTLYDATEASFASNPRPTAPQLVGIDFATDGTLYGLQVTGFSAQPLLMRIDPVTGAATPVGTGLGVDGFIEGDMAFDPATGTLFVLYGVASNDMFLYTVDTVTGLATLVGSFASANRDPSGMAFDGAGNLWVLNTQPGTNSLLRLDKTNAQVVSDIGLIESGSPYNSLDTNLGMDFDPVTGTMFAATTLLWTIDTATGTLTALLGGSSFLPNVPGLAVVPAAVDVPEPAAVALLALGLVGVAAMRRRAR